MSDRRRSGTIVSVKILIDGRGDENEIQLVDNEHIIHCIKLLVRWREELKEALEIRSSKVLEERIKDYERSISIFTKTLNKRYKEGEA